MIYIQFFSPATALAHNSALVSKGAVDANLALGVPVNARDYIQGASCARCA